VRRHIGAKPAPAATGNGLRLSILANRSIATIPPSQNPDKLIATTRPSQTKRPSAYWRRAETNLSLVLAFVVWRVDIDHAEWGTMNMTQVAIQEWKDGRIVREKFVYW
jgi:hypothetical protein